MMTVIEVDGTNVKPLRVDSIQIFAGKSLRGFYSQFGYTYCRKRPTLLLCRKLIVSIWDPIEYSASHDYLAQGQPTPRQLL